MNAKIVYYVMIGIIGLLGAAIIGSAYGINALLTKQSTELSNLKAKVVALQQEQSSLTQAKKDISKYTDLYSISKVVVPQDKNQAQAVRQIVKLAAENEIALDSISFPASTLGATAVGTSSAATQPTTNTKTGLSQLTPVAKIPGVYDMQLTVTSNPNQPATYSQLINFLAALEHNRQTALVSSMNIQPDTNNKRLFSFNLILDIYIKP